MNQIVRRDGQEVANRWILDFYEEQFGPHESDDDNPLPPSAFELWRGLSPDQAEALLAR